MAPKTSSKSFVMTQLLFLVVVFFHQLDVSVAKDTTDQVFTHPLDPKNPFVIQAAEYAVKEHNKQKLDSLVFRGVVRAQGSDNPDFKRFNLDIAAADSDILNTYRAVVLEIKGAFKLLSFQKI